MITIESRTYAKYVKATFIENGQTIYETGYMTEDEARDFAASLAEASIKLLHNVHKGTKRRLRAV